MEVNRVIQGIKDAQALMDNFANLVSTCHPDWARTAKAWIQGANEWLKELQ